jgi:DNA-binding response OmpR family regulator
MAKITPHILVVDDDILILKFIESKLKKLGYHTSLAKNGKEAIDLAKSNIFDLIISDLYMPLMDGNELVKHIRKLPEYHHTPFIFLSGSTEEETWIKNLNDGADDFITKPLKLNVFISKIQTHLKKAYLRKDILNTNQKNNISFEKGHLIYCANSDKPFPLSNKHIKTNLLTVEKASELFTALQGSNIWGIIIDDSAEWAIQILEKIAEIVSSQIPISILISDIENIKLQNHFFKYKISNFLYKQLDIKIILHQINSSIEHEHVVKQKYMNALNSAAKKSPIRFEHDYETEVKDYKIQILHEPYDKLPGGDYYEIIEVDENRKIVILGDVMGKKWDAWFFVPAYIAYIRSTINFFRHRKEMDFIESPGKFLEIINQYIYKDLQLTEVFTTLSIISICSETNKIAIASAGALRPYYYDSQTGGTTQMNIVGTLLGIVKESKYRSLVQKFEPNDKIIFYTDGYNEAVNDRTGNMVGDDAILQALDRLKEEKQISPQIIEKSIARQNNISKFDDDRTLLLIQRN